jgi:hypothetical protein
MIHCCVIGIASWVILSNAFETEADEVVVYKIQKQTIKNKIDTLPATIFRNLSGLEFL